MSKQQKKYLPVIASDEELRMPWDTLRTIIGGKSIIDTNEIHTKTEKRALSFLRAYGISPDKTGDASALRMIRDFAIEYLDALILSDEDKKHFPDELRETSIVDMLSLASNWDPNKGINWPCVVLKVCHATAHALWTHDSEAHEKGIEVIEARLAPYLSNSHGTKWIGDSDCNIPLLDYTIKREKLLFRVITKLLYKPGNLSSRIRDHVGVRFVVEDIFSAVLLIKFLRTRGIFMYVNNIPEEAKNSLADLQEIEQLYMEYGPPPYDLSETSGDTGKQGESEKTINPFSSQDFGMIKLIERLLVTLPSGRRTFFPYELQILTRPQWESLDKGETHHDSYESRQVRAVKERLLS